MRVSLECHCFKLVALFKYWSFTLIAMMTYDPCCNEIQQAGPITCTLLTAVLLLHIYDPDFRHVFTRRPSF